MQNLIDVINEHDQSTGQQVTIDAALHQGLWHRGAHVAVCTTDGLIVVQKRSRAMHMHPGLLDISCGGFVDAGETPEEAALRETKEELGLAVTASQLKFIGIHRQNHFWRKLGVHNRALIYCYVATIPSHKTAIVVQPEEVEWAKFIPLSSARRLVRLHRLKSLGRLEPAYGFYRLTLNRVAKILAE